MKNGLLFVLLMAALVAMAMPAAAIAPTIQNLPTVVIGDKEDIDTATNAVLLRYVNAIDISTKINTPNSGDPAKLKIWYETTGAKLKVGTPTIKAALTAGEVTALKAATPTAPPAAKELTNGTAFWLSLIQDSPGVGKTSPTSVATATAAANGATVAEYNAAGVTTAGTGKAAVTLYAYDDALTSKSWAQGSFDVYSRTGGVTDQYSQSGPGNVKTEKNYTFEGTNAEGWVWLSMSGVSGFVSATQAQTATAIGHTGASGTSMRYSSWAGPLYAIPAVNQANRIFTATMEMSGTAANAAAAPGFRFLYADGYYMHVGGMQVLSNAGVVAFNAPYTGNNRTLKLVWAVPSDLTEYADSGKMNGVFTAGTDLRSYSMIFDIMQTDATDSGNIMLENMLIQSSDRPANVTPTREWGGTGTAFNAASIGWANSTTPPTGFTAGTGAVTAGNFTAAIAGTNTTGWVSSFPNNALDLTRPSWTAGKVLRTSYKVASSDAALVPNFRILNLATYKTQPGLGPVFWGDSFSYSGPKTVGKATPALSPNGLPGAPKTAGSTIEVYAAPEYPGTGTEDAVMTPQFDLADGGGFTYPSNGWARPSGTLTVSSVKMEVLDAALSIP